MASFSQELPGLATYFRFSFRFFKKGSCQLLRKYVHEVLVNRLGGLSLPRKSVGRLTDRPDMTLDVYHGRKTTIQQQLSGAASHWEWSQNENGSFAFPGILCYKDKICTAFY